jgi:hypothetical protein
MSILTKAKAARLRWETDPLPAVSMDTGGPECCRGSAQLADFADTYAERVAICLEAGDIGEAEAEVTAAVEVGRAFVRNFVHDQRGKPP